MQEREKKEEPKEKRQKPNEYKKPKRKDTKKNKRGPFNLDPTKQISDYEKAREDNVKEK